MSPIPSFAQVAPSPFVSTTPISLTPLSFRHLSALGAFFLVFVLVALGCVLSYALFKLCRPGERSKTALRPFILPKLIPADVAASAIAAKFLFVANHRHQGFIAYTTNANGVKKSVRIRPRDPQSTHGCAESGPSEPHSIINPIISSNMDSLVSDFPLTPLPAAANDPCSSKVHTTAVPPMAAPTKTPVIRNAADLNANPKLFPVQGPLKPLETCLPTTSLNVKRKISLLSLMAVPSPVLSSTDPSKKHSGVASSLARSPKHPPAVHIAPPSTAHFKVSIVRNVEGMNANPKLFPVQGPIKPLDVRRTNARVPANALMASSLADNLPSTKAKIPAKASTESTVADIRSESSVQLAPVLGTAKSFHVYRPSQQAFFGPHSPSPPGTKPRTFKSTWTALRGKENIPVGASTSP